MKRRVVVTGVGLRTCLGPNPEDVFRMLMAGGTGFSLHADPRVDRWVGAVKFDPSAHFSKLQLTQLDRVSQLAMVSADDAIQMSLVDPKSLTTERTGIFIGSGYGGADTAEHAHAAFFGVPGYNKKPLAIPMAMMHAPAAQIGIRHHVHGECQTYSTACSSSAVAIGEAFRRIRDGYLDHAIAGGSEALLTPSLMHYWAGMQVLASKEDPEPARSCRPFSKDRSGFVISEGACVLILEEREGALRRNATVLAEVIGYGVSNDASHITKPDHQGQVAAMRHALADAGVEPDDIGYVNAHGTATTVGDAVEVGSIKEVFGQHARRLSVSSTKSSLGHSIGATGAIEFAVSALALHRSQIPPTASWSGPDEQCDLDFVPHKGRAAPDLRHVMTNSFAFGGNNAVLVLQKAG